MRVRIDKPTVEAFLINGLLPHGFVMATMLVATQRFTWRSAPFLLLGLCLGIAACDTPTETEQPPALVAELEKSLRASTLTLDGAVLSVWEHEPNATWFVGGTAATDGGFVLFGDAEAIRREATPPGPLLWWVTGTDSEHVWAVGERGRILRRRGGVWQDESPTLDERAILYGVWAASPNDLWAVGGSVRRNGPKGLVLRSSGDGNWVRIADPALPRELNLYKVWGRNPDDVLFVGEGGVIVHWNGTGFARRDTGVSELLFTVHGQPAGPVIAVGGLSGGVAFSDVERGWVSEFPSGAPGLNGVFVRKDGLAIATGNRGAILVRDLDGDWFAVRAGDAADIGGRTLHAIWSTETTWAVGGDLSSLSDGIILTSKTPAPRVETE